MSVIRPHYAVSLILCQSLALCAEIERPDFAPLLHVAFDGDLVPVAEKAEVTVTGGEGIEFVEGMIGQAVSFGEGDCVEYRNIPALDPQSATIEFWVKPDFERLDLGSEDHYFIRLLTGADSSRLDVRFGRAIMTGVDKKVATAHGEYQFKPREWNHVVVTWDTLDPGMSTLRFYVNGTIRGYERFSPMGVPEILRVGCKSQEEGGFANALIDEICVYNRCLTEMQVLALYENADLGAEKIDIIRERVASDDAISRQRMTTLVNERKIAMVVGRTISGWSDRRFEKIGIPAPPRIDEAELENANLSQYDMLLFPGGGGFVLSDEGQDKLRQYLMDGGGYVGVCAGLHAAKNYGLIERETFRFREIGMCEVTLREHPITEGFNLKRKLDLYHYNGSFIEAGDLSEVAVMYNAGPPYACVVARQYGEGRVVVFSAHPEGMDETRALTRNAILWATKVTGMDDEGEHDD